MENVLEIQDLKLRFYTYEGVVEALDDVNLTLKEGETLGIVGETGCGKTVTGYSMLVLVPTPGKIEGGKILLRNKDQTLNLLDQDDACLRGIRGNDISMIFQEPRSALNPLYTVENQISEVLLHHRREEFVGKVLEQLEKDIQGGKTGFSTGFEKSMYLRLAKNPKSLLVRFVSRIPILRRYGNRLTAELRKEVVRLLDEMRIPDPDRVAGMYPHELSGGMAQRAVIAMGLAGNPRILVADEPTTNLDVTVQLQILNLIRDLKKRFGSTIHYITHDLGIVAEMCDRVAVMYAGNVVETAEVVELFKHPLHPYTRALLESIPRPGKEFKSIEGTVPSLIKPPVGCRFHDRCSYAMEQCRVVKPKMMEAKKDHWVHCHLY